MNEELDLGNGSPVPGLVRTLKRPLQDSSLHRARVLELVGINCTYAPKHLPPSGPNLSVTIGRFRRAWCLIFGISLPGCCHGFALRWL